MDRAPFAYDGEEFARVAAFFGTPPYEELPERSEALEKAKAENAAFAAFAAVNVAPHRQAGYAIVTVSLKPIGGIPGDATSAQMRALRTQPTLTDSASCASAMSRTLFYRM